MGTTLLFLALIIGCTAGDDVPAPVLGSVTPDHATPGNSVTIQGDYLCQQPEIGDEEDPLACANTGTVSFGQSPAVLGMYTEQLVTAEVPPVEAGVYSVTVSVAGRRSNALSFTVDAQ